MNRRRRLCLSLILVALTVAREAEVEITAPEAGARSGVRGTGCGERAELQSESRDAFGRASGRSERDVGRRRLKPGASNRPPRAADASALDPGKREVVGLTWLERTGARIMRRAFLELILPGVVELGVHGTTARAWGRDRGCGSMKDP